MAKMSKKFYHAYGAVDLDLAIKLYSQVIEEEPENFAAWNNRGVSKVHKAVMEDDKSLAEEGKSDFEKAIKLANEYDNKGFPIADNNLIWVESIIAEM